MSQVCLKWLEQGKEIGFFYYSNVTKNFFSIRRGEVPLKIINNFGKSVITWQQTQIFINVRMDKYTMVQSHNGM